MSARRADWFIICKFLASQKFQAPLCCSQGDCPLSTCVTNSEDPLLQGNYLNFTYMLENLNMVHDLYILF